MIGRHDSEPVRVVGWLMVPFILMFGLYVVAHGHYGPGGGFAGGVILAVAVVLARLIVEDRSGYRRFPPSVGLVAMALGMSLFLLVGFFPMLTGASFLDYSGLPGDQAEARLRYLGILIVEGAIGLAVFGGIVLIFDRLVGRKA